MPAQRLFFLCLIFTQCLNVTFGQNIVFPLARDIKGSVKSFKEVSYKAIIKEGKVIKGDEIMKSNYLLDTKKQLIEKDDYDSSGAILERYVANYDNNENILEEMLYTPDSVISKFKYRYDNRNNRIGWMSYTRIDTAIARGSYHYDDKGRIISDSLFDAKGKLAKCESFDFDEQGQLVKESHTLMNGDKFTDSYELDMDGNRIQDTKTRVDGSTASVTRLKYNSDGKLTEKDVLSDSSDDYALNYKCAYDNAGHKIKETKFFSNRIVDKCTAYDSVGDLVFDSVHCGTGIPTVKLTYRYDKYRDTLGKAVYVDNSLVKKYSWQYDAKRNKTGAEYQKEKDGDIYRIQIENDRMGNPIKEVLYKNNQPETITEREFVFY